MPKTILLVDDDPLLIDTLTYSLKKEGFQVVSAANGLEAVSLQQKITSDVVVLDIMLPGIDGWEVCRRIRRHSAVPVIMLTARDDEFDRVLGLEIGADDYLAKPFSFRELLARIRAILRRVDFDTQPTTAGLTTIGAVTLDHTARRISKNNVPLSMTQKEYDLVFTLMSRAGQVITRAELFDLVWGVDWIGDARTLDVHIRWIREKLEDDPGRPVYVQTVRGVGYRFATPEEIK